MTTASCKTMCCSIYKRIAEIRLSEYDRRLAVYAMRDAEAIADAVVWAKDRIASLGAMLPKLGFKYCGPGGSNPSSL